MATNEANLPERLAPLPAIPDIPVDQTDISLLSVPMPDGQVERVYTINPNIYQALQHGQEVSAETRLKVEIISDAQELSAKCHRAGMPLDDIQRLMAGIDHQPDIYEALHERHLATLAGIDERHERVMGMIGVMIQEALGAPLPTENEVQIVDDPEEREVGEEVLSFMNKPYVSFAEPPASLPTKKLEIVRIEDEPPETEATPALLFDQDETEEDGESEEDDDYGQNDPLRETEYQDSAVDRFARRIRRTGFMTRFRETVGIIEVPPVDLELTHEEVVASYREYTETGSASNKVLDMTYRRMPHLDREDVGTVINIGRSASNGS